MAEKADRIASNQPDAPRWPTSKNVPAKPRGRQCSSRAVLGVQEKFVDGLHVIYYVPQISWVFEISVLMISNLYFEIICSLRRAVVAPLSQLTFQNRSGTPWRGLVYISIYV